MKLHNRMVDQFREFEAERNEQVIPAGYVEVKLSTRGKLGAPEVLHIRNFKVGELVALSLTNDADTPRKLIEVLNDMILEDIDVANFHEKEVEELMVYVYINFFKNNLEDVIFPIEEADLEQLKEKSPKLYDDVKSGKWVPRTTINIASDTDTYEIPEDFTPDITITNKSNGFFITFGYIKYGDRLVVKEFLDKYYADEESKFARIKTLMQNGESDKVSPEDQKAYTEFETRKFGTLTDISRIISVKNYNGMDVSEMKLADKYELLNKDARIDYGLILALIKKQNKMPFGIKPEVRMINPFTHKPCTRRFSFRISTLLQAFEISGSDQYDDGSDVESVDNVD